MTTITLEVPDDLAAKLDQVRDKLPALLDEVMNSRSGQSAFQTLASTTSHRVYEEMIDFLAGGPSPDQIIQHKASEPAQRRLSELLEKNGEEGLTEAEAAELDLFELVEDIMGLLKARARCMSRD